MLNEEDIETLWLALGALELTVRCASVKEVTERLYELTVRLDNEMS